MIRRVVLSFTIIILWGSSKAQEAPKLETNLAGVYQGKTLFIQNPFNKDTKQFCVKKVYINQREVDINYKLSALKIDFDGFDLYTPVKIRVVHRDTICKPVIINPEAVLYHTIFRFTELSLSDSALVWKTKGETGLGEFEVERLYSGVWRDQEIVKGTGEYNGTTYVHFPNLEEGPNKYRIKYNYPAGSRGRYLYSWELDYDHYPEPIEFTPKSAKTRLYLSRASHYEIYDANHKMVLEGQGVEIDVTVLRRGRYSIYFNGKDPGTFVKE